MAEVKKTSVDWLQTEPYVGTIVESPDGWKTIVKDEKAGTSKEVRDLYKSFNVEEITEEQFRDRLKKSNAMVPAQKVADVTKKEN